MIKKVVEPKEKTIDFMNISKKTGEGSSSGDSDEIDDMKPEIMDKLNKQVLKNTKIIDDIDDDGDESGDELGSGDSDDDMMQIEDMKKGKPQAKSQGGNKQPQGAKQGGNKPQLQGKKTQGKKTQGGKPPLGGKATQGKNPQGAKKQGGGNKPPPGKKQQGKK
jgi:hypothetical protein